MTRSTGWLAAGSSVGWLAACLPASVCSCRNVDASFQRLYMNETHTQFYIYIKFVCVHAHIHIYTSAATVARNCNGIPAGVSPPVIILIFECRATNAPFSPPPSPSIHRGPFYGTDARSYTTIVAFCVRNRRRCRLRDSLVRERRKGDDVTQKEKSEKWREGTAVRPLK